MNVVEAEGKTKEEAIKKALKELGDVSEDQVRIEELQSGRTSIFGLGSSKLAKVRVYYMEEFASRVKEKVDRLFELMGIPAEIDVIEESEDEIDVVVKSDNSGLLIGKRGKTLEALQFMANILVNQKRITRKRVILDIEGYRKKKEEVLRRLAVNVARSVIETGETRTLAPMNPFERRLVHLALQDELGVETVSEGLGNYKKIQISPRRFR